MTNRDGLVRWGRLIRTFPSGFWTPSRTAVDPQIPYLPLETPTGGAVLVTIGVIALTLATFAPTVAASDHKLVVPSPASLVTATFAPSVNVATVVVPSTTSLTLTTFAPTVATPVLVTPISLALVIETAAPTVTASDHHVATDDIVTRRKWKMRLSYMQSLEYDAMKQDKRKLFKRFSRPSGT